MQKIVRYLIVVVVVCATILPVCAEELSPLSNRAPTSATLPEPVSQPGSFVRMIGGLLFCLGVFGAGVHLYRRFLTPAHQSGKRRMRVVERLALSPKSTLVMVSCDGREILLAVGAESARVVQGQLPASYSRELFEESIADMYSLKTEEKKCVA